MLPRHFLTKGQEKIDLNYLVRYIHKYLIKIVITQTLCPSIPLTPAIRHIHLLRTLRGKKYVPNKMHGPNKQGFKYRGNGTPLK